MDDSIYAGLLEQAAQASAVGVVLEPTHNFNEGVFRGGTKYILLAIMRQLQRKDVGYKPLAKLLIFTLRLLPIVAAFVASVSSSVG